MRLKNNCKEKLNNFISDAEKIIKNPNRIVLFLWKYVSLHSRYQREPIHFYFKLNLKQFSELFFLRYR